MWLNIKNYLVNSYVEYQDLVANFSFVTKVIDVENHNTLIIYPNPTDNILNFSN
jgi:hypothetical protein